MDAVYQTLQRTARRKHSLKRLTVSMRCVMFVSETVPKRQNLRGTKGRFGYQLALVKKKKKKQKRMNEEHFAQMKMKIQIEFEMAMILSRENNASVASIGIHCSNGDAHWKVISNDMAEYCKQEFKILANHRTLRQQIPPPDIRNTDFIFPAESTRSKVRRNIDKKSADNNAEH
ncbi:hypothetical protein T09_3498 [Trichinella sp. T9]|nr:hypothetical protein T09_3498 [Trichinella sp. T9]